MIEIRYVFSFTAQLLGDILLAPLGVQLSFYGLIDNSLMNGIGKCALRLFLLNISKIGISVTSIYYPVNLKARDKEIPITCSLTFHSTHLHWRERET